MIKVEHTKLPRVLLISPEVYEDYRGENTELYNSKLYKEAGIIIEFVYECMSVSRRNVLRGIHGDSHTWKLVSCLYGSLYLVVVNCDGGSPHFGKWEAFTLSDRNRKQILIPPYFGNGHLVLSETAIFYYKLSDFFDPRGQFTYKWNDPRFNIWWPVKNPIQSCRDEEGHYID